MNIRKKTYHVVQSPLGKKRIDSTGAVIGAARMNPATFDRAMNFTDSVNQEIEGLINQMWPSSKARKTCC